MLGTGGLQSLSLEGGREQKRRRGGPEGAKRGGKEKGRMRGGGGGRERMLQSVHQRLIWRQGLLLPKARGDSAPFPSSAHVQAGPALLRVRSASS